MSSVLLPSRPAPSSGPPPDAGGAVGSRLSSLTALRWWAALAVFALHARNLGFVQVAPGTVVGRLIDSGATGVSLFFVLSGFVLGWVDRPGDRARAFWRRRVARVYPLHLLTAVTAVVAIAALPDTPAASSPSAGVANLLLVSAWWHDWWQALNPVSWSLVVEAFFYAVFPWVIRGVRRLSVRATGMLITAMVTSVVVLAVAADVTALPFSPYDFPPARLPEFVAGVAAARLVQRGAWRGPSVAVSCGCTVAGLLLACVLPPAYGTAAATLPGFVLLVPALARRGEGRPGPVGRMLVRLGTWSFAFYLVHLQLMWLVAALAGRDASGAVDAGPVTAVLVLAAAIAVAALLHHLVEQPAARRIAGSPRRREGR